VLNFGCKQCDWNLKLPFLRTRAQGSVVDWDTAANQKVSGSIRDEAIGYISWPNPSSHTCDPVVDSSSNINEYQESLWEGKGRPARKIDNLTKPRRQTTVWISTACYKHSFTFLSENNWKAICLLCFTQYNNVNWTLGLGPQYSTWDAMCLLLWIERKRCYVTFESSKSQLECTSLCRVVALSVALVRCRPFQGWQW
jgi:hypothetical protein